MEPLRQTASHLLGIQQQLIDREPKISTARKSLPITTCSATPCTRALALLGVLHSGGVPVMLGKSFIIRVQSLLNHKPVQGR